MKNNTQKQAQLVLNDITDTSSKRTIYSIGHSNVSVAVFAERLWAYKIDRVIDVRTKPYSRWCPWANKDQLAYALAELDINYDWRGSNLGGLGVNMNYEQTIQWVFDRAEYENIVLLCSEGDYRKCHRFSMLTPSLEALGAELVHIGYR
jgi:uncharacterized protein (DUF488 family)